MKCPDCGITVPEMPENSTYEEHVCNGCYSTLEEYLQEWGGPECFNHTNVEAIVRNLKRDGEVLGIY